MLRDAVLHLPGGDRLEGWMSVSDGHVDDVGTSAPPAADTEVDCNGRWVLPGLVDIHVHLRDPGFTHKEDFTSGSAAAAAGGVTTVIDMPNTGSLVVSPDDLREKLALVEGRSYVDFGLYALLVDSAPFVEELASLGVAGLKWLMGYASVDGRPSQPSSRLQIREALRRAADADLLVGVHAEDLGWISELGSELRAQGRTDARAHGDSRPAFVEAVAISEAAILASEWGARLHVHHLSSSLGLRVLGAMREATGGRLTAETCPHYLVLDERDLESLGTRGRVNPPLRTAEDVDALWKGLVGGQVDCVASDHAPHALEEKETGSIWDAQSGLIGVETTFPLLFSEVRAGRLPVRRFVEATAERPAELVGLGDRKGKLQPGYDADFIIVDPDVPTRIDSASLHSKHPRTVFEGREGRGRLDAVFLRGERIVDRSVVDSRRRGVHIPSRRAPRLA